MCGDFKQNCTQENLDMAMKGKYQNRNWIFSKSSTKQQHESKLYWSTQQNSKCRLCEEKEEMVNHISRCSKLVQKEYKSRHDWVGKVIHREFCKRWKPDHTTKWYIHKMESVRENKTYKILRDFETHTNHRIFAWRPDWVLINKNKRICRLVELAILRNHKV